jgi:hypothetical protein
MVDVAVASQLQQWTFEKPALTTRPERSSSGSSASSPNLGDDAPETLRLDVAPTQESSPEPRRESMVLQECYMSSEEDLSTAGSDSEYDYDDAVIHDPIKDGKVRTMSISRWDKGRSCDMAVMVSYAQVGRPKVIELDCRGRTDHAATLSLHWEPACCSHPPATQSRRSAAPVHEGASHCPSAITAPPPLHFTLARSRPATPTVDKP